MLGVFFELKVGLRLRSVVLRGIVLLKYLVPYLYCALIEACQAVEFLKAQKLVELLDPSKTLDTPVTHL